MSSVEPMPVQSEKKMPQKSDQNFREWMLVTRKKRPVKYERGSTTKLTSVR